jgi:hypothetical protein
MPRAEDRIYRMSPKELFELLQLSLGKCEPSPNNPTPWRTRRQYWVIACSCATELRLRGMQLELPLGKGQ